MDCKSCGYQWECKDYCSATVDEKVNVAIDMLVDMLTNEWGLDIIFSQKDKTQLKKFIECNGEQIKEELNSENSRRK